MPAACVGPSSDVFVYAYVRYGAYTLGLVLSSVELHKYSAVCTWGGTYDGAGTPGVGATVGTGVGAIVGTGVGASVGAGLGAIVGEAVATGLDTGAGVAVDDVTGTAEAVGDGLGATETTGAIDDAKIATVADPMPVTLTC